MSARDAPISAEARAAWFFDVLDLSTRKGGRGGSNSGYLEGPASFPRPISRLNSS